MKLNVMKKLLKRNVSNKIYFTKVCSITCSFN